MAQRPKFEIQLAFMVKVQPDSLTRLETMQTLNTIRAALLSETFKEWEGKITTDSSAVYRKAIVRQRLKLRARKDRGELLACTVNCFSIVIAGEPYHIYPNDFRHSLDDLSPLMDPLVLEEGFAKGVAHFQLPQVYQAITNTRLSSLLVNCMSESSLPSLEKLMEVLPETLEEAAKDIQSLVDFCEYFAVDHYGEYLQQLLA